MLGRGLAFEERIESDDLPDDGVVSQIQRFFARFIYFSQNGDYSLHKLNAELTVIFI